MSCLFCSIISGQSPAQIVYRDDLITAFHDIRPAAPVHLLIVPNQHLDSLNEASTEDQSLLGHMLLVAQKLAKEHGIEQTGYRLVINTGPDSGQIVFHLHLHLIGGKRLPAKMYTTLH